MPALTPEEGTGLELAKTRILAVLVIDDPEAAVPLAEALLAGGVGAMELTLRTPAAVEAIGRIASALPEMRVGAGTVLTSEQITSVKEAGAAFAVSPGINPEILDAAERADLPFGPGIMTPTDIDLATRKGARLLKFFPATSAGGLDHLHNIAAPFSHLGVKFIPLGGIRLENMNEWLNDPLIAAVGGSWLAPRSAIQERDWKRIERNAREASQILNELAP
ncbi:MAG: bifunctional 4-hydroxy-2-oxoglutarate aldolase/2-dehydro-3-deoxy-phosphogluconate aldolase [Verrucomicrobiota bacterium]